MTKQCYECKVEVEDSICPQCQSDAYVLNLDNPMDAFIAHGGFNQMLNAAIENLPESVVRSLGEVS